MTRLFSWHFRVSGCQKWNWIVFPHVRWSYDCRLPFGRTL